MRSPDELSEDAWGLLEQALKDGTMLLPSGKIIQLDASNFVRVVQWLATLKPRKPTTFAKPEDFQAALTKGKPNAS